jgi:hypothetical protein
VKRTEKEIFELVMASWLSYKITRQVIEESVYSEPSASDHSGTTNSGPKNDHDTLGRKVDRMNRLESFEPDELEAAEVVSRLGKMQKFVTIEAVAKRRISAAQKLPTQRVIAAMCQCTIDEYKKRRATAKKLIIARSEPYLRIIEKKRLSVGTN